MQNSCKNAEFCRKCQYFLHIFKKCILKNQARTSKFKKLLNLLSKCVNLKILPISTCKEMPFLLGFKNVPKSEYDAYYIRGPQLVKSANKQKEKVGVELFWLCIKNKLLNLAKFM